MNQKHTICLIVINYNSDNEVLKLINNVEANKMTSNLDILIVDNSDVTNEKNLLNDIIKENKKINYLKSKKNIGYFGGARLGLNYYREKKGNDPDFLIISNADITFKDNTIIKKLNNYNYDNDIGVIAPSIISARLKRDKNPKIVRRPKNYIMHFYKLFFRSQLFQNFYILIHIIKSKVLVFFQEFVLNKKIESNKRLFSLKNIYAPHGSIIIFTKNYFNKGGTLDYPCFLFNEEVFIAETIRSINLRVVYDNEIKIFDDEHITTGLFRSKKIAKYVAHSSMYIANKYFKNN